MVKKDLFFEKMGEWDSEPISSFSWSKKNKYICSVLTLPEKEKKAEPSAEGFSWNG